MPGKLKISSSITLILFLLFNLSCSSSISKMVLPELNDGKYDSEFPYKNASEELKAITQTIRMVHSMAFYKSYSFDRKVKLKRNELRFKHLKDFANSESFFHESVGGTATVIYSKNGKTLFLTCAHILNFPDTLVFYYNDVIGQRTDYISDVAIKTKQNNYIPELKSNQNLTTIAFDSKLDLAVLEGKFSISESLHIRTFKYPLGRAANLNWGTFVYLFGYPLNNKMVTKGIVSPPQYSNSTTFFVDASINKGFSGGLVLAIKDGIPNFELVGIVRSGAGKIDYYLKPADGKKYPLINSKIPFNDKIYVDKNLNLRYGITNVISIESILGFLEKNKKEFIKAGYNFDQFFN